MKAGELYHLPDSAELGRRVARRAGLRARAVSVHRFPDRESLVRVAPTPSREVVLFAQLHDPNAKLFDVLLAADALRRAGARRIRLLAPYLPYMRQDTVFEPGEALSQHVFAETLGRAVDEIITLEPHLHRIRRLREVFPCRARALHAAPLLANWAGRGRGRPLLVGPDAESAPWVRALSKHAGLPFAVCEKRRLSDRRVKITVPALPPASRAILVDDIASSGTTLAACARALRREGVETVDAAVVHAIFAPGAMTRIRRAGVRRLVSCDTIPHETNAIDTSSFFAAALTGQ
jgi:ribose-phosphate pyrophosphokinase